jgi:hypothetical protein
MGTPDHGNRHVGCTKLKTTRQKPPSGGCDCPTPTEKVLLPIPSFHERFFYSLRTINSTCCKKQETPDFKTVLL